MRVKNLLIYVAIFFLIGEVSIRIDKMVGPFDADSQVKTALAFNETPELAAAQAHRVANDDSTFRVMVLGDSYVHGMGFDPKKNFSSVLKARLSKMPGGAAFKKCQVLDLSRPDNNCMDNLHGFTYFDSLFPPHLVVLAYNHNDVYDDWPNTPRGEKQPGR